MRYHGRMRTLSWWLASFALGITGAACGTFSGTDTTTTTSNDTDAGTTADASGASDSAVAPHDSGTGAEPDGGTTPDASGSCGATVFDDDFERKAGQEANGWSGKQGSSASDTLTISQSHHSSQASSLMVAITSSPISQGTYLYRPFVPGGPAPGCVTVDYHVFMDGAPAAESVIQTLEMSSNTVVWVALVGGNSPTVVVEEQEFGDAGKPVHTLQSFPAATNVWHHVVLHFSEVGATHLTVAFDDNAPIALAPTYAHHGLAELHFGSPTSPANDMATYYLDDLHVR